MYKIPILINIWRNQVRVKDLFKQLELVKPDKLYIFQDGGKTAEIVKQLDECLDYAKGLVTWECNVKTYRLEDDIGPAAAEYYAYKWMFSYEEMGIIIEDDLRPNKTFFDFAEKMLDRYKNDERISYISGTNPYGVFKSRSDYFFSTRGSLYCWATWKRFIDTLDINYAWLDKPNIEKIMLERCCDKYTYNNITKRAKSLRKTQTADFEIMVCAATVANDQFAVVPKFNLVMNCGIDASSVNGAKSLRLMPKCDQKSYYAKTYDGCSFDNAPADVCEEKGYRKYYNNSTAKRLRKLIEILIRRIWFGVFGK